MKFSKININRWAVFGLVALAALLTTAYIDNVFRVNNLLVEVRDLDRQLSEIRTSNDLLNSKLIELQSAERITRIAENKLGMIKPRKAPLNLQSKNDRE